LVEAVCAAFFGLSYYLYGLSWLSVLSAIFLSFMLVIVVYDFQELSVPESVSWVALVLTLIMKVAIDYSNFTNIILGALIGGGIIALLVLISRGKWMGEGDIKVGTTIGIFLTFPIAIIGVFSAFFSGALAGITLIVLKIKKTKDPVPFTPFLLLGGLISMVYGQQILDWYLEMVIF
jgi:prepilin signal peptidase PulO-like enzyme (type II secretory pathway)